MERNIPKGHEPGKSLRHVAWMLRKPYRLMVTLKLCTRRQFYGWQVRRNAFFLSFVSSQNPMLNPVKLEHFRNLVALSAADGRIADVERSTLLRIATNQKIPVERVNIMLSKANEYAYLIPQNVRDREAQLDEMISLALVDGVLDEAELALITMVAEKLQFTREELQVILEQRRGQG